jgi:hypothetical protein
MLSVQETLFAMPDIPTEVSVNFLNFCIPNIAMPLKMRHGRFLSTPCIITATNLFTFKNDELAKLRHENFDHKSTMQFLLYATVQAHFFRAINALLICPFDRVLLRKNTLLIDTLVTNRYKM